MYRTTGGLFTRVKYVSIGVAKFAVKSDHHQITQQPRFVLVHAQLAKSITGIRAVSTLSAMQFTSHRTAGKCSPSRHAARTGIQACFPGDILIA